MSDIDDVKEETLAEEAAKTAAQQNNSSGSNLFGTLGGLASLAAGIYGARTANDGRDKPVGFQGQIPNIDFVRQQVPDTAMVDRRPGAGGMRYFSDYTYSPYTDPADTSAYDVLNQQAYDQALDLRQQNFANAGYGAGEAPPIPAFTGPETPERALVRSPFDYSSRDQTPETIDFTDLITDPDQAQMFSGGYGYFPEYGIVDFNDPASLLNFMQAKPELFENLLPPEETGPSEGQIDLSQVNQQVYEASQGTAPINLTGASDADIAWLESQGWVLNEETGYWEKSTTDTGTDGGGTDGGGTDVYEAVIADLIASDNGITDREAAIAHHARAMEQHPDADANKDGAITDAEWAAYKAANPDRFAGGGLASLQGNRMGMYLGGSTDGMADRVPANIEGQQPAALSHGEFVVPADVVSHLGNGNSDAGADALYEIMAEIRKDRTGSTKQGKQINPNKYFPT